MSIPAWKRLFCVIFGLAYPTVILVAIVATANHFLLDAAAGGLLCGIAWKSERVLLNLLPLEDCFLWCLRMHKPELDGWDREFSDERWKFVGSCPSNQTVYDRCGSVSF